MKIEQIAELCHETNAAYCRALGDLSQMPWPAAPHWQQQSAINGVKFHLANPTATEAASHESWLDEKLKDGWKYGPIKNQGTREHPCFVPFTALPAEQQVKDALFKGVVDATRRLVKPVPFMDADGA